MKWVIIILYSAIVQLLLTSCSASKKNNYLSKYIISELYLEYSDSCSYSKGVVLGYERLFEIDSIQVQQNNIRGCIKLYGFDDSSRESEEYRKKGELPPYEGAYIYLVEKKGDLCSSTKLVSRSNHFGNFIIQNAEKNKPYIFSKDSIGLERTSSTIYEFIEVW